MSAENRPVFQDPASLQPEQQLPEVKKLLPKKEFQEEKMTSIMKQFTILKMFEVNGATELISKENFPDIPEERLETFRFFSDTNRVKELRQKAGAMKDPVEQESLFQEANALEEQRNERNKKFREKANGKTIFVEKPPPKVQETKPKASDLNANTGLYM